MLSVCIIRVITVRFVCVCAIKTVIYIIGTTIFGISTSIIIISVSIIRIINAILIFSVSIIYGISIIGIIVYKLRARSVFHVKKGIRGVSKLTDCSVFMDVKVQRTMIFVTNILLIFNFMSPFLWDTKLCTVQVFFKKNIYLPLYLRRQHKGTLLPVSHQINCQQLRSQSNVLIAFIVPINPPFIVLLIGSQVRCSGQSYSLFVQGYIQPHPHGCMDWVDKYGIILDAQSGSCAIPQHQLCHKVGRRPLLPWRTTRQSSRSSFHRAVCLTAFH